MPSVAKFQANLRPSTSVVFTIWLIFEGHLVKNCSDKHQHSRKNNIYHLNFFNNLVAEKSLRSFWNCWFTVIICSVGVLSMKLTWQTLRRTLWKTLKGFLKDYKSFQSLCGLSALILPNHQNNLKVPICGSLCCKVKFKEAQVQALAKIQQDKKRQFS